MTTAILISIIAVFGQNGEKKYKVGCIAFYNLENLFDTIDTPGVRDTEFSPEGSKKWNSKKYYEKLDHMADVISQIGTDFIPIPPAIIGVSEIENINVLKDLVNNDKLKKYNYQIIHKDSPDKRGIDCALLYMPQFFKVTNYNLHHYPSEDTSFHTRDQLMVSGKFDGDPIHIIVNHWPSRSGGEKRSRPKRNKAGELARSIVDSIYRHDADAKILVMGDLNDDPTNQSVKKYLNSVYKPEDIQDHELYNPFYDFFKKGIGSLAYHDTWNNFDQILISKALLNNNKNTYKYYTAKVFNKKFMTNPEGRFKGYPKRTFAGGTYQGGYSDHFPVFVLLVKQE